MDRIRIAYKLYGNKKKDPTLLITSSANDQKRRFDICCYVLTMNKEKFEKVRAYIKRL